MKGKKTKGKSLHTPNGSMSVYSGNNRESEPNKLPHVHCCSKAALKFLPGFFPSTVFHF